MNDWRNIGGVSPAMSLGECQVELAAARKENAELKESFLRMAATLENTRKNTERDIELKVGGQMRRVALGLLDVADNLERALAHAEETNTLRPGVQATLHQLQAAMAREGIQPIVAAPGQPFDPHQHEAISGIPADVERDTVAKIVRTGYSFASQVLRPTQVIVATPRLLR